MSGVHHLNQMPPTEAQALLHSFCGSGRWVEELLALRPFGNIEALEQAADRIWFGLDPLDWMEAFTQHPKIGDLSHLREKYSNTAHFAVEEQKAARGASTEILTELAQANSEYERKFGFIFLVCATGKSADEILGLLKSRMGNEARAELKIAAQEQAKITRLRLRKWLENEKQGLKTHD